MSGPVVVVGLPPQHVQQQPQPLFLHHHHHHQQQQQVMILNGYGSGDNGNAQGSGGAGSEESLEQAQELLQDKKSLSSMLAQRAMHERRLKPPDHVIPCPRCQSINTKFCYYNNYSLTQPRHFCKNCRRYWTAGGTLRNVPVGGGCRKNKRVKRTSAAAGGDASNASSSADSSVVSGGFRAEGVAAGGTAAVAAQTVVHHSFLQAAAAAATGGSSFFDNPQYDEATKAALARAQQAMRAGSSGVGHSSHESSPGGSEGHGGCSLSAPSLATQPFESGIMSQGFFGSASAAASKQHDGSPSSAAATSAAAGGASGSGGGGPLSNGDLNAIFEAHAYRAAAAAAAGATGAGGDGGGLNGYSSHHVSDHVQDSYHHHHVDSSGDGGHAHWRLQQQQHSKSSSLWDEAEQHNNQAERDEAVQMPHSGSEHHHGHHHGHHHQQHHQHHQHQQHYKSAAAAAAHAHAESLRHALKGKSSLCLSPSSGLDEEGTSPCSVWAAPANPSGVNPYDNAQDGGFSWPGAWTTPLELMPSSGNVPFGMRSEHLFDLPKPNLVNPVGFGLDEFHSDNRKLA